MSREFAVVQMVFLIAGKCTYTCISSQWKMHLFLLRNALVFVGKCTCISVEIHLYLSYNCNVFSI